MNHFAFLSMTYSFHFSVQKPVSQALLHPFPNKRLYVVRHIKVKILFSTE